MREKEKQDTSERVREKETQVQQTQVKQMKQMKQMKQAKTTIEEVK